MMLLARQTSPSILKFSLLLVAFIAVLGPPLLSNAEQDVRNDHDDYIWQDRLQAAKLEIWARGGSILDETFWFGDDIFDQVLGMEAWKQRAMRQGPVLEARYAEYQKQKQNQKSSPEDILSWISSPEWRGGASAITMDEKILGLTERYGAAFAQAIEQNRQEHIRDCQESCEFYYCASSLGNNTSTNDALQEILHSGQTTIRSYSMGAVPPEDFADDFGFPLDLIKVTQGMPLFSEEEAQQVVDMAEQEGLSGNEYVSGKYKLGGNWLTELPETRKWFNDKLQTTFFPLLAHLFPEIVSDTSVLRAHSVSLLKYNSSHPRTDVHVDNGILAMTLAMTPQAKYHGGGTFFEHFAVTGGSTQNEGSSGVSSVTVSGDKTVLPMDVGHGTFRPGSVRHGGNRVTQGTRYILGAFLLIEDRVEHVRRLKNRGSELRRSGNLEAAAQHFEWALALNSKCTTCLKDWAEILHTKKEFKAAEAKIREALELLEYKDSDALFTLGLLLSEQGKDAECLDAYRQSLNLNSEDAELLYNLGVKISEQPNGDRNEEIEMYRRCTEIDPSFGGAWLNLGTVLAESGNLEDAEVMFLKAMGSKKPWEVKPKAMINLALIHHNKVGAAFQQQDIEAARAATVQAANYLDTAKPILDNIMATNPSIGGLTQYLAQHDTLRLACYRNMGQIYAGMGEIGKCEEEFRRATDSFPHEIKAWQMLGRVLEIQGKSDAMQEVISKIQQLQKEKVR
jgi:tetratricopeptide (TPR) repeat protein